MNRTELASWRFRNPDYLFPKLLRSTWEAPPEWGEPVWRLPVVLIEGEPPRAEMVLYRLPAGVTPRPDFLTPFPGTVLVTKALPRGADNTSDQQDEDAHH